jgi:hypothetical protein
LALFSRVGGTAPSIVHASSLFVSSCLLIFTLIH